MLFSCNCDAPRQVLHTFPTRRSSDLKAPEEQLLAAETVLRRNATVRSTERLVARQLGIGRSRRRSRRVPSELSVAGTAVEDLRSEEHTSELQSPMYLVCRLLLEKKKY